MQRKYLILATCSIFIPFFFTSCWYSLQSGHVLPFVSLCIKLSMSRPVSLQYSLCNLLTSGSLSFSMVATSTVGLFLENSLYALEDRSSCCCWCLSLCLLASEDFNAYMNEYSGLDCVMPFSSFFSVKVSKSNYIYYKKRVAIKGQDCHGFGGTSDNIGANSRFLL